MTHFLEATKARLGEELASLQSALQRHGLETEANRAATLLAQLNADESATLIVVGEFNAGKSTLVNALCGVEILPAGIVPTTATVNVVSYNPEEVVRIHYSDGNVTNQTLSRDALKKLTARYGEHADIRMVEIQLPGAPRGLILVDTPGVNDINETRAEIVYDSMLRADAVLMVMDAQQPMKRSEIDFLRKRVLGNSLTRTTYVLNHIDRLSGDADRHSVIQYARKELGALYRDVGNEFRAAGNIVIANELERLADSVPVYCISAKHMLQARMRAQSAMDDEEGLLRVFDGMGSRLQRDAVITERIGAQALALTASFRRTLQTEKALAEAGRQRIAVAAEAQATALRSELQKAQGKLKKLKADRGQLISDANSEIGSVFSRATDRLEHCTALTPAFCEHIQESVARDIESVLQRINSKLVALSRELVTSVDADVQLASAGLNLASTGEPNETRREDKFGAFLSEPKNQMLIYLVGPFVIWSLGWIGVAAAAIPFVAHLFGNGGSRTSDPVEQARVGLQDACRKIQSELSAALEKRLDSLTSVVLRPIDEIQSVIVPAVRELCSAGGHDSLRITRLDEAIRLAEQSQEAIGSCLITTGTP